ncbi:GNAT family N-acetyltransferase [Streptomyces sp. NBC_01635]|uniref:GNAT family N-acetyltransferase n=1 Tax=Streptomyces sp. NBC_01635 TaxID=2975904 RepID=UPI00386A184A|nr:GNAT family N-acetyltransferase [Streptomyces sp. NBC_01635]
MDIVIRPVEPYECEELGEITAQAYLRDGLLDFGENDTYLGELRNVAGRAAAAEVLVAVEGTGALAGEAGAGGAGRVLGGVTFVPRGGPMADIAGPGEAEIRMLAVARAARRRGVGEALVRACADRARATEGCVRIVLSTQRTMRAAHRIYERLGFVRSPGRDWNPVPHLDDITLLTYELTL